ncbi:MAG: anti-sigma factor [Hyphomicrobiaceae bacterium]
MTVVTDVMLMQLADGVLDAALEPAVRAAIAADPALQRRYETYRATGGQLAELFSGIAKAPPPAWLVDAVHTAPAQPAADWRVPAQWPAAAATLMDRLRERAAEMFAPGLAMASASALAAALVIGAAAGWALRGPQTSLPQHADAKGPLTVDGAMVFAAGDLRRALDADLSAGAGPNTATRIAVSFKTEDGRICRQYEMRGANGGTGGVACRTGSDWRIEVQAALAPATATPGTFKPASDGTPKAVAAFIDDTIAGDYLTKTQESEEIKNDWRR